MTADPAILSARERAVAARARIDATLAELQERLNPRNVAHNAWADTVDRGADAWDAALGHGMEAVAVVVDRATRASETGAAYARRKPEVIAAGATAAAALLFGPTLVRRALRRPPPKPVLADPPRLTGPIPHLETHR